MSSEIKFPSNAQFRQQAGELTADELRAARAGYRMGYIAATQHFKELMRASSEKHDWTKR